MAAEGGVRTSFCGWKCLKPVNGLILYQQLTSLVKLLQQDFFLHFHESFQLIYIDLPVAEVRNRDSRTEKP